MNSTATGARNENVTHTITFKDCLSLWLCQLRLERFIWLTEKQRLNYQKKEKRSKKSFSVCAAVWIGKN